MAICLLCSIACSAYDFKVDGKYYNIISTTNLTCEITRGVNKYKGEVVIPSVVIYKNKTYRVTKIRDAFYVCKDLTSITIPPTVTTIDVTAFVGCSSLKSITALRVTPPAIEDETFTAAVNATLYVQEASLSDYQNATGWKNFFNIKAIPKCETPSITFADGKLHFESVTPNAVYHYTLVCNDVASDAYSESGKVALEAAYKVTAYATAENVYYPSDNAKATLYWLKQGTSEESGIINAAKRGVVVSAQDGFVTLSGLENGEKVSFYSTNGTLLGTATAYSGIATASFATGLVVIAKIGTESIKVSL